MNVNHQNLQRSEDLARAGHFVLAALIATREADSVSGSVEARLKLREVESLARGAAGEWGSHHTVPMNP